MLALGKFQYASQVYKIHSSLHSNLSCLLLSFSNMNSKGSVVNDLSENDAQSYTSLSILVVDCDTECLTIVSDMLRRFEYKVITAKRAADALRIVRETENELDLILTETHLPDMKMYEFLEALGQMSNLPIVVMSVENHSKAILGSYHKGAVFYLVKPLMMNDVKNLWQFAYISETERMMPTEGLSGCSEESQHDDSDSQESVVTMEKQVLLYDKGNEQEEMDKEDARPKNILEHMSIQGLNKEQVFKPFTGPTRAPNFMQRQYTLQNSFPGFSRPDTSQFGFRNFVIGELPHSKKMKIMWENQGLMSPITRNCSMIQYEDTKGASSDATAIISASTSTIIEFHVPILADEFQQSLVDLSLFM